MSDQYYWNAKHGSAQPSQRSAFLDPPHWPKQEPSCTQKVLSASGFLQHSYLQETPDHVHRFLCSEYGNGRWRKDNSKNHFAGLVIRSPHSLRIGREKTKMKCLNESYNFRKMIWWKLLHIGIRHRNADNQLCCQNDPLTMKWKCQQPRNSGIADTVANGGIDGIEL